MTEKANASAAMVKAAEGALTIPLTPDSVRRYINPYVTDAEIALFLNQCMMFDPPLNPFKREIHLIKYSQKDAASFVVGYETYLKRAERTRNWAGLETGVEFTNDGSLLKAWARVYRKDWTAPLYHEVFYSEYVQLKDEWVYEQDQGKSVKTGRKVPNRMWSEKPITMLKKVAVAQSFRMAFPDEMGGMPYIEEEIHHPEGPSLMELDKAARERAAYEASKKQPLRDIHDEFGGPPPAKPAPVNPAPPQAAPATPPPAAKPAPAPLEPGVGFDPNLDLMAEAEAAAGEPAPDPGAPATQAPAQLSMKALEKFAKIKAELALLGVNEETMWRGIHNFTSKTLNIVVAELSDFTEGHFEMVHGYLCRWRGALVAKDEGKKNGGQGVKK